MALDPNELGAWINSVANKSYLLHLRNLIDDRLERLGFPAGMLQRADQGMLLLAQERNPPRPRDEQGRSFAPITPQVLAERAAAESASMAAKEKAEELRQRKTPLAGPDEATQAQREATLEALTRDGGSNSPLEPVGSPVSLVEATGGLSLEEAGS